LELKTTTQDFNDHTVVAETFGQNSKDIAYSFPFTFCTIEKAQNNDKQLLKIVKLDKNISLKAFRGGGKSRHLFVDSKEKIIVPQVLQQSMVDWYHYSLCHPGENRTELTIKQHFNWTNMKKDIQRTIKKCHVCQLTKKTRKKYGHLPPKEAESVPWETLCVDLIGPYTINRTGESPLVLHCLTMIDPATSWLEMVEIPNKQPETIANLVELVWLTRYPRPDQVIMDRGKEFMTEFSRMMVEDYGIQKKPTTVRNPQANAILERVHQTVGNIIRTFQMKDREIDYDDPWSGVLAATMYAVRSTYHTTLQATPMQVVFGRDALLNIKVEADWNLIRNRKQELINKNNLKENKSRIKHEYKEGDLILVKETNNKGKYDGDPRTGPYKIVQVNQNGTVRYKKGAVIDTINIRQIEPYFN